LHYIYFVSCPAVCKPYLQCLSVVSIQYFRCLANPSGRAISCRDFGSKSRWRQGCLSLVSVVCCQVEVSATGRSLIQRNPYECGASECDREASVMRKPWPTRGCWVTKKIPLLYIKYNRSVFTKESSYKMFVLHGAVLVAIKIRGTCLSRGFDCSCLESVAYPGIFFGGGGVQQIQLKTEDGDLGAVAP